jgi:repressor LexA
VVLKAVQTAGNGDIVAALIGDEATVKRLELEPDEVRLTPANSDYQPLRADEATILGKVVAVFRRL